MCFSVLLTLSFAGGMIGNFFIALLWTEHTVTDGASILKIIESLLFVQFVSKHFLSKLNVFAR